MTEVVQLLARLRSTITDARSVPMSGSVMVSRGDLLAQLDDLRGALDRSAERKDAEVEETREGDETRGVEEARGGEEDKEVEVPDSAPEDVGVIELLETARRECAELRRETDEYVDDRLAQLEQTLTRTLEAVSRGRGRIQERSRPADAPSVVPGLGFPDRSQRPI